MWTKLELANFVSGTLKLQHFIVYFHVLQIVFTMKEECGHLETLYKPYSFYVRFFGALHFLYMKEKKCKHLEPIVNIAQKS